jgi:hypothetical protein
VFVAPWRLLRSLLWYGPRLRASRCAARRHVSECSSPTILATPGNERCRGGFLLEMTACAPRGVSDAPSLIANGVATWTR